MAKSVNRVTIIGNIGKQPEVKFTTSGVAVATFSVATNERYKDKSGEWQDRTEWINIKAFDKLADIIGKYLTKGSKIYIEGKLQTSSWTDKTSGETKYRTEVVANEMLMLDSKGSQDSNEITDEDTAPF